MLPPSSLSRIYDFPRPRTKYGTCAAAQPTVVGCFNNSDFVARTHSLHTWTQRKKIYCNEKDVLKILTGSFVIYTFDASPPCLCVCVCLVSSMQQGHHPPLRPRPRRPRRRRRRVTTNASSQRGASAVFHSINPSPIEAELSSCEDHFCLYRER